MRNPFSCAVHAISSSVISPSSPSPSTSSLLPASSCAPATTTASRYAWIWGRVSGGRRAKSSGGRESARAAVQPSGSGGRSAIARKTDVDGCIQDRHVEESSCAVRVGKGMIFAGILGKGFGCIHFKGFDGELSFDDAMSDGKGSLKNPSPYSVGS